MHSGEDSSLVRHFDVSANYSICSYSFVTIVTATMAVGAITRYDVITRPYPTSRMVLHAESLNVIYLKPGAVKIEQTI